MQQMWQGGKARQRKVNFRFRHQENTQWRKFKEVNLLFQLEQCNVMGEQLADAKLFMDYYLLNLQIFPE